MKNKFFDQILFVVYMFIKIAKGLDILYYSEIKGLKNSVIIEPTVYISVPHHSILH